MNYPDTYLTIKKAKILCDLLSDEFLEEIKSLIERDTPKKGVIEINDIYGSEDCYCPCCDAYLEPPYELSNFCPDCGQRLDWSEE